MFGSFKTQAETEMRQPGVEVFIRGNKVVAASAEETTVKLKVSGHFLFLLSHLSLARDGTVSGVETERGPMIVAEQGLLAEAGASDEEIAACSSNTDLINLLESLRDKVSNQSVARWLLRLICTTTAAETCVTGQGCAGCG